MMRRNKRGVEMNGHWYEYNKISKGILSLLEVFIKDTYKGDDYKTGDALQDFFNLIAKPGHHNVYSKESTKQHKRVLEYAAKIIFFLIKDKKTLAKNGIISYKHVLKTYINRRIYISSMNLFLKDIAKYYREFRLKQD